jgi:hypothetical protein
MNPHAECLDVSIAPNFQIIKDKLSKFSIYDFSNTEKINEYCELFSIKEICKSVESDDYGTSSDNVIFSSDPGNTGPYLIQYDEICRLHYLCLTRKVLNTLEFGSGYSTAVMADAKRILSQHFEPWAKDNLRVSRPFHVYAVEEEQRYLEITNQRVQGELSSFVTVSRSSVELGTYDNHYVTYFSKIPNISPDLILLDGPGQFSTTKEIQGFNLNDICRMPMAADILKFEFFLEPGALIVVDGRTANARFLKSYLRMNWVHYHDVDGDVHLFELQELPLGKFNAKKLNFCLNNDWLLK